MNIPEGWPTVDMLQAAENQSKFSSSNLRPMQPLNREWWKKAQGDIFKAMLAAAPTPPARPAIDFDHALETHAGEPVKWITSNVIEYRSARVCVDVKTGVVYSSPYVGLKIRNIVPITPPAQEVEPVAWLYEMKVKPGIEAEVISRHRRPDDGTWIAEFPLIIQPYATRPQSDELRKAASEVTKYFDDGEDHSGEGQFGKFFRIIENLRAALEKHAPPTR